MTGTDEHPDVNVVAEFTGYRASARATFAAPSTSAVFATARTRVVRRRLVTALTAVVTAGALLTGAVLLRPAPSSAPPVGPASSTSPDAADSGTATPDKGDPDKGNRVRFLDQATIQRLRGMTVTLPKWPGGDADPSGRCPAGRFTFRDGQAAIDNTGRGYVVLRKGLHGIFADLDGSPGDEVLVPVGCGRVEQEFGLLALQPTDSGFQAMGYLVHGSFDRFFPDGADLVVEVVDWPELRVEQRRHYRWQGSRFVQVGGPTTFPTGPVAPPADPRNGTLSIPYAPQGNSPCNSGGTLSFVDGASGAWGLQEDGISIDAAGYLMGAVSRGTLARPADAPGAGGTDLLITMTCRRPDGFSQQFVLHAGTGSVVVATGRAADPGLTGIVANRVVDGLAEVTVQTDRGQEVRRYRFEGHRFTRVS